MRNHQANHSPKPSAVAAGSSVARPVQCALGATGFGLLRPHAFTVELQDGRVMHQPINRRHGGQRVLEDLIPFREH